MTPRGVRNRNPMNVKVPSSGEPWKGMVGIDAGHAVFSDPCFSFRAALRLVFVYIFKHNLTTLRGFFERYAPASDNNKPLEYAQFVGKAMGVGIDDDLREYFTPTGGLLDKGRAFHMLLSMNIMEVGNEWRSEEEPIWYGIYQYERDYERLEVKR